MRSDASTSLTNSVSSRRSTATGNAEPLDPIAPGIHFRVHLSADRGRAQLPIAGPGSLGLLIRVHGWRSQPPRPLMPAPPLSSVQQCLSRRDGDEVVHSTAMKCRHQPSCGAPVIPHRRPLSPVTASGTVPARTDRPPSSALARLLPCEICLDCCTTTMVSRNYPACQLGRGFRGSTASVPKGLVRHDHLLRCSLCHTTPL